MDKVNVEGKGMGPEIVQVGLYSPLDIAQRCLTDYCDCSHLAEILPVSPKVTKLSDV